MYWLLPFHDLPMTSKFSSHRCLISLVLLASHFQKKSSLASSVAFLFACLFVLFVCLPSHLMDQWSLVYPRITCIGLSSHSWSNQLLRGSGYKG